MRGAGWLLVAERAWPPGARGPVRHAAFASAKARGPPAAPARWGGMGGACICERGLGNSGDAPQPATVWLAWGMQMVGGECGVWQELSLGYKGQLTP